MARADTRPRAQLIPWGLREELPSFPLPLRPGEAEPAISLSEAVRAVYDAGRYAMRLDYQVPPEPPLRPEDEAWADTLLRERGLR